MKTKSIDKLKAKNLGGFTKAFDGKIYVWYNTYTMEEIIIKVPRPAIEDSIGSSETFMFYKRIKFYALFILTVSCSTFDKQSGGNNFSREGQYVKFKNENLNIENLMYGGLDIISSQEEKRKFPFYKFKFNNIIYYANMDMGYSESNVKYDYYILSRYPKAIDKYSVIKKIECNNKKYYLIMSDQTPIGDRPLVFNSFKCIK